MDALENAAVSDPGRTFDGTKGSRAATEADDGKTLDKPAAPENSRRWVPGPIHPPFNDQAPAAADAGKAESKDGCQSFFSCLGPALISPITTPLQGLAAGAALGAVVGGKAGFLGSAGGGLLGAVLGLVVGLILMPIVLASGLVRAFGKLFNGDSK